VPFRAPINPEGYYHVSSRGSYGRPLFTSDTEHETFLRMYERAARRYAWDTLEWVLMGNHHHFVVHLTRGGLSAGMRELHGGYSRWIHERLGLTGQGHLFRHAFFARELKTDREILVSCVYVALNATAGRPDKSPEEGGWCGYRATIGLDHARCFHNPSLVLELLDRSPRRARQAYRDLVEQRRADRGHDSSPNDDPDPRG